MPTTPTVFSGENGAIKIAGDVYVAVKNWKVTKRGPGQALVDSATAKGTARVPGPKDWSGSFSANGYPAAYPGATVAFVGSMDGAKGCSGNIIIESVRVSWDISTGAPVSHEVTFSGNGELTLGAGVAVDASVASPVPGLGTKVSLATPAAEPTYTELDQVQTITLEFKAPASAWSDSSTAGYTKRVHGPLDWSLSIKCSPSATQADPNYGLEGLPQPGSVNGIKIEDANGDAYLLDWGMFGEITDIEVSRETQGVVSCTITADMCGFAKIADVWTAGSITEPGGSTVWPET